MAYSPARSFGQHSPCGVRIDWRLGCREQQGRWQGPLCLLRLQGLYVRKCRELSMSKPFALLTCWSGMDFSWWARRVSTEQTTQFSSPGCLGVHRGWKTTQSYGGLEDDFPFSGCKGWKTNCHFNKDPYWLTKQYFNGRSLGSFLNVARNWFQGEGIAEAVEVELFASEVSGRAKFGCKFGKITQLCGDYHKPL